MCRSARLIAWWGGEEIGPRWLLDAICATRFPHPGRRL
jgi:hypothetical protein